MNEKGVYPDELVDSYVDEQELSTEVHNCVFGALDKETQSPVAVKMMCQGRDNQGGYSPSLPREIGFFMSLSHPNIVGVIDARRYPNGVALVMEWTNRSSHHHLDRSSPFAHDLIRFDAFQLLTGSTYLSEREIVHWVF